MSLDKDGTAILSNSNGCLLRNEVIHLWCDIFTSLITKVRDFVLLQESYSIWRRYSPNGTTASKNGMIHLWCNSRLSSHFLQQNRTWLLIYRNGSFLGNEVIALWCDIFTSVMRKVRNFIFLLEESPTYSPNVTAASQKEVIHLWCNFTLSYHWKKTEQDY